MPKLDIIGILILVDKVALVLAKQRGTIMGREMYCNWSHKEEKWRKIMVHEIAALNMSTNCNTSL